MMILVSPLQELLQVNPPVHLIAYQHITSRTSHQHLPEAMTVCPSDVIQRVFENALAEQGRACSSKDQLTGIIDAE